MRSVALLFAVGCALGWAAQSFATGRVINGKRQRVVSGGSISGALAPPPPPCSTGNISYWKFDGNSTDSFGVSTATDTGVTYAPGKIASGLVEDGVVGHHVRFTPTMTATDFSVAGWIKPSAGMVGETAILVSRGTARGLYFNSNTNQLDFFTQIPGSCSGSITITLGVWTHVAITSVGGNVTEYVNGVADPLTYSGSNFPRVGIGEGFNQFGEDNFGSNYIGMTDEIGVWNVALTPAQITTLYNSGTGLTCP